MLSRYRAHGLLGASGGGDIFSGLGPAKPTRAPTTRDALRLREDLIESGELVPVEVEGVRGKRFVLREEVDAAASAPGAAALGCVHVSVRSADLGPPLLASLFDFDYVWDLFFPPEKRRWGWYVLPIIFRDRFVGRIEPRIDRDGNRVEVIGLWWEEGFSPGRAEGFVDAMREALRAYLRFAGAGRLEWAPQLRTEKRRFTTRP